MMRTALDILKVLYDEREERNMAEVEHLAAELNFPMATMDQVDEMKRKLKNNNGLQELLVY